MNPDCAGATVVDVVTTDYWPSIGILLSNNSLLYMDAPSTHWYMPVTSALGDMYKQDEIHSIWDA